MSASILETLTSSISLNMSAYRERQEGLSEEVSNRLTEFDKYCMRVGIVPDDQSAFKSEKEALQRHKGTMQGFWAEQRRLAPTEQEKQEWARLMELSKDSAATFIDEHITALAMELSTDWELIEATDFDRLYQVGDLVVQVTPRLSERRPFDVADSQKHKGMYIWGLLVTSTGSSRRSRLPRRRSPIAQMSREVIENQLVSFLYGSDMRTRRYDFVIDASHVRKAFNL